MDEVRVLKIIFFAEVTREMIDVLVKNYGNFGAFWT